MREEDPTTLPSRPWPPKVSCLSKVPSLKCTIPCSPWILFPISPNYALLFPSIRRSFPIPNSPPLPMSCPISLPIYDMPNLPLPPWLSQFPSLLESVTDSESDSTPFPELDTDFVASLSPNRSAYGTNSEREVSYVVRVLPNFGSRPHYSHEPWQINRISCQGGKGILVLSSHWGKSYLVIFFLVFF